jgi:hypothetical protein
MNGISLGLLLFANWDKFQASGATSVLVVSTSFVSTIGVAIYSSVIFGTTAAVSTFAAVFSIVGAS